MSGTTSLRVDAVRTDGGTQSRVSIDAATIDEYASAYLRGVALPPPVVFFDGESYWVADGMHRVFARRQAMFGTIDCDVRQGTKREAVLFSVGANATHGKPRTDIDKRSAVLKLLNDAEWGQRSSRWIAEAAAVSDPFVETVRASILTTANGPQLAIRTAKDGRSRPAKIDKDADAEKRAAAARALKRHPEWSDVKVEHETGLARARVSALREELGIPKTGRGRPKGSKNKPKEAPASPVVERDVEEDGRHIADASALVPGAMAYGDTPEKAEAEALDIVRETLAPVVQRDPKPENAPAVTAPPDAERDFRAAFTRIPLDRRLASVRWAVGMLTEADRRALLED